MGKRYRILTQKDIDFIEAQKLFYIASCSDKEVNLSPKGYKSIKVLDEKRVLFLDYPGSGNRTYRDAVNGGRFTLLFNAFEGKAKILRLFCKAEPVEKEDARFEELFAYFDEEKRLVRRLFIFHIEAVETSCGEAVPYMRYEGEREQLRDWAKRLSDKEKLDRYIKEHHEPPSLEL